MTTLYLQKENQRYKLGITEYPEKLRGEILRTFTHVEAYYLKLALKDKFRSNHIEGDWYRYINPKWFDDFLSCRESVNLLLEGLMRRKAKGIPLVRNKRKKRY